MALLTSAVAHTLDRLFSCLSLLAGDEKARDFSHLLLTPHEFGQGQSRYYG